jgi:hypothetical protein
MDWDYYMRHKNGMDSKKIQVSHHKHIRSNWSQDNYTLPSLISASRVCGRPPSTCTLQMSSSYLEWRTCATACIATTQLNNYSTVEWLPGILVDCWMRWKEMITSTGWSLRDSRGGVIKRVMRLRGWWVGWRGNNHYSAFAWGFIPWWRQTIPDTKLYIKLWKSFCRQTWPKCMFSCELYYSKGKTYDYLLYLLCH